MKDLILVPVYGTVDMYLASWSSLLAYTVGLSTHQLSYLVVSEPRHSIEL
jgi:hypothetical protein